MPRPPLTRSGSTSSSGKSSSNLNDPPKKEVRRTSLTENAQILIGDVLEKAVSLSPAALQPVLRPLIPAVAMFFKALNAAEPYLSVAFNKTMYYSEIFYKFIEPYEPEYILPMIIGIFMILFGGQFMMIVACFEAYRICGWQSTRDGFVELWDDYKKLRDLNSEDDSRDDDNDGIPDVLEISEKELLTRKILLFLRACDPEKVGNALNGIYSGFIAVVAAVRVRFARTVALGVALGDILSRLAIKFFVPFLEKLIPPAYHRWLPVIVRYGCKAVGIWIASTIERVLSTFHSALRGANMFISAFAIYTARRGMPWLSAGYWDEIAAYVLCALGVYWQLSSAFTLPPIVGLILWPLNTVESLLTYYIYSSDAIPVANPHMAADLASAIPAGLQAVAGVVPTA